MRSPRVTVGMFGYGSFARLLAPHLTKWFDLLVCDPRIDEAEAMPPRTRLAGLDDVAGCAIIILATPVEQFADIAAALAGRVRSNAVVIDVGSVKSAPCKVLAELLPASIGIVGTHPLFGPQSAKVGIAGHSIVVCPVRGPHARLVGFLERKLNLEVVVTTPDRHDRDMAVIQGLTHLIAKIVTQMEPVPSAMRTASFSLLMQAVDMVRHDSEGVFSAIQRTNPYSREVRDRFLVLAETLRSQLD